MPVDSLDQQSQGRVREISREEASKARAGDLCRDKAGTVDTRSEIHLEPGQLPRAATEAEAALLAERPSLVFQRGGRLVQVVTVAVRTVRRGIRRPPGALVIREVEHWQLVDLFSQAARWFKVDGRRKEWTLTDCPERVAKVYASRFGSWRVPELLGVVEAPTLRPDGSVLATPGYDAATGLLYVPGDAVFAPVPPRPTKDQAVQALLRVRRLFEKFPFVEPSDAAAILAACLTAVVRRSLPSAPMFALSAPKMAAGKSLLADCVALIATGRTAAMMSQGKNEEEDCKRLLSLLKEGTAVSCIDNIERPLSGAAMCTVLTEEFWTERLLGINAMLTVPTHTTWLATGNNLLLVGEVTTRVIPCDIDPGCERPEERKFELDLRKFIPDHRETLVPDLLTVARAYLESGSPDLGLARFGRYEDWERFVRGPLVWCGEVDPCAGRKRLEQVDPVRRQLRLFLVSLHALVGSQPVTASQIIDKGALSSEPAAKGLQSVLEEVAEGRNGQPDGRRLGRWLSRYAKRVETGFRIMHAGERQGVILWQVLPASAAVGLEGFVGLFQPNAENCQSDSSNREGESNPRNPPNPPQQLDLRATE
ncbi:MAG: hypothetical protein EYC70_07065 [Planctomycetota bacterium]|nr:MAG: hypothetical protein EYC70_07065 [Planctomycetota bacterium]